MGNQAEQGVAEVFEIIWRQHHPDDWIAEIRETRTDRRCLVYSFEELRSFLRASLGLAEPQQGEP